MTTPLVRPGSVPPQDEEPHAFTLPSVLRAAKAYPVEKIVDTFPVRPGSLPPETEKNVPHRYFA